MAAAPRSAHWSAKCPLVSASVNLVYGKKNRHQQYAHIMNVQVIANILGGVCIRLDY